jgi:hypothetical protein
MTAGAGDRLAKRHVNYVALSSPFLPYISEKWFLLYRGQSHLVDDDSYILCGAKMVGAGIW